MIKDLRLLRKLWKKAIKEVEEANRAEDEPHKEAA
jgi:hypothetical protein